MTIPLEVFVGTIILTVVRIILPRIAKLIPVVVCLCQVVLVKVILPIGFGVIVAPLVYVSPPQF